MRAADALRSAAPAGYYLREEKSNEDGGHSLSAPDVVVTKRRPGDSYPNQPALETSALVLEVDQHTHRAHSGPKLRRYAARGVPVYRLIRVELPEIQLHTEPRGKGRTARDAKTRKYTGNDTVSNVIDGCEVGRVVTESRFPAGPPGLRVA
jgi:hypothetical protein